MGCLPNACQGDIGAPDLYLEEAHAVASPPVVAEASVTITLKIPSNIVRELRAYSAISELTMSEIVRRAISAFLSAARGHG